MFESQRVNKQINFENHNFKFSFYEVYMLLNLKDRLNLCEKYFIYL